MVCFFFYVKYHSWHCKGKLSSFLINFCQGHLLLAVFKNMIQDIIFFTVHLRSLFSIFTFALNYNVRVDACQQRPAFKVEILFL